MSTIKELYLAIDETTDASVKLGLQYELAKALLSNDPTKAAAVANDLLELAQAEQHAEHIANARLIQGNIHYMAMRYTEAEALYTQAIDTYPDDAHYLCMPRAKMLLGLLYTARGEADAALDVYQPLLQLTGSGKEHVGFKADLLTNIGNTHALNGEIDKTEQYYKKALELLEKNDMHDEGLHIRANLASLEGSKGNYERSIEQLLICQDGFKRKANKHLYALSTVNLALAYAEAKYYAEALVNFQQALKLFKEMNDEQTIYAVHIGICKVYKGLQGYNEAIEHADKAIEIAARIGYPTGRFNALIEKGKVWLVSGHKALATKLYDQAIQFANEKGLSVDPNIKSTFTEA